MENFKMRRQEAPNWNPYQTFIWNRKQIQAWYDIFGSSGQYDGKLWKLISKKVCPDRYEIKFKSE